MFNKQVQEMRQLWERYVTDQVLDTQRLRPHVAASWQRCFQLNINPYGPPQQRTVKAVDQNWSLDRLQDLIKVSQPVMENLHNFVGDSGFQVVLAGSNGYILSLLGGNSGEDDGSATLFLPGDDWSEPVRGTNAIGTCLVEQKPLQIHGCEHYCEINHSLSCSAAPIFEPDGALIGVLNVSGECQFDSLHTLGMVAAGANAIENQLRLLRTRNKLRAAYKYSTTITNAMSEGLVTVDNDGNITKMNDAAAQILNVVASEVVGLNVGTLLGDDLPIVDLLKNGVSYEEREVILESKGLRVFSSGCLLYDDQGNNTGAVAVIRAPAGGMKAKPKSRRKSVSMSTRYTFDEIMGHGKVISEAKRRAKIAAQSPSTVLLQGESGTGKEMFAQSIHRCGNRSDQPFVAINCAATPETLIESELFGYEEGAFTGARKGGKLGKIELADGGTLFLDEIGDMPLHTQVKLLRVLQERKLSRVGSNSEIEVDIRVIAATHRNLSQEIEAGRFRTDLYFRLNVLCITIPSLRDRLEDLPLLINALSDRLSSKLGRSEITIADSFLKASYVHPWPGNIRELENVLERAINMADEDGVLTAELMELQPGTPKGDTGRHDQVRPLKEVEREMIIMALDKSCGNIVKATQMLGISRNTMYRKIKEYDIEL
ncbi:MAG: sigma-54-dependent Fis family transcriptional regulator [Desulfuromonas sp.]|nr:sigma-54-dependent Fis family transcriptional regulator [Desulfuromonas sp.]